MGLVLWALGLVLILEGIIWALFPKAIEDLLAALRDLPLDTRRGIGLGAAVLGAVLVWIAQQMGVSV